jgi:RimJ/RimL family protein N-acetyltransferase
MPPTLETDRLRLRPLGLQDLDAYVAFWQDPAVVRFISGSPLPREQSWRRLIGMAGHWQLMGFGFFAIEEKCSGQLIGEAGFQEMRRDLHPTIEGTLETGWGILPAFQGKGYATEAGFAAMDWAERTHPALDYSCIISPENRPSLNLARKLGFVADVTATYMGKPVVILRLRGRGYRDGAPVPRDEVRQRRETTRTTDSL